MMKILLLAAISAVITLPNGDQIPDYSRMGYRWGDREIPTVEVVKELSAPADSSDATKMIQQAIDDMTGPGAILLKAGTYKVYGSVYVNRSGIVIRGEGAGKTVIIAAGASQRSLFVIGNPKGTETERDFNRRTRVCDEYVPLGSLCFPVQNPEFFSAGDRIMIHETHNPDWIHAIRMDRIMQFKDYFDRCVIQWTPEQYSYEYERIVSRVEGNKIWIDAPISLAVYPEYGGAEIYPCSVRRVEECGVESLSAVSEFNPAIRDANGNFTDEVHAWTFVDFCAAEHCFLRDCTAEHFGYALALTQKSSKNITVCNCKSFAPVSLLTGGRRYGLCCRGQLALFKDCALDGDRHGMVTNEDCPGPNAYVNCVMTNAYEDAGPHNNWGIGTLYDCCKTNKDINVQDRQGSGLGHGWAGASTVMWNCEAERICAQSIWGVHNNYVIGCIAKKSPGWYGSAADKLEKKFRDVLLNGIPEDFEPRPEGIWISQGKKVKPGSLYAAQMKERRAARIRAVPDEYYLKNVNDLYPSANPPDSHEMVDLGLSVKWAACNLDAAAPYECGGYYSWGEVQTKTDYTYPTYKWSRGDERSLTKYCDNAEYGSPDGKMILEAEDDAASVKWGNGWRMPTADELYELADRCRWECVRVHDMVCYRVTGPNGNSILLPLGGNMSSCRPQEGPNRFKDGATYNSSSLSILNAPFGARGLYIYPASIMKVDLRRAGGRMVRAVHE